LQESLDDVSSGTGITVERLIGMEQGLIRPSADEIFILADHWACDFGVFVSNEPNSSVFKETEILYRRHGDAFTKQDRRAVQEFLYLSETEAFLLRELDKETQKFTFTPIGKFFKSHGEQAALALRKFFGYEDPDRLAVPRDIYADFRKLGVHVFRRQLTNSNISGLFLSHEAAGNCLLVNYNEDVYRQRFTTAHEMAHAIFDAQDLAVVSFINSRRSVLAKLDECRELSLPSSEREDEAEGAE
jgi:hypothetical protein